MHRGLLLVARRFGDAERACRGTGFVKAREVAVERGDLAARAVAVGERLGGGALALGHPLGATGARITGKAAALLKREGKQFALATQCIGGGQGIATILEAG